MITVRNVLLLNGVVRQADAISRSLCLKRDALAAAFGTEVQIDIAAYAVDDGIPGSHCVNGLVDLLMLDAFKRAELIIYEFGIFYDLFGSVRFAPPQARTIAIWHNVTPPELAPTIHGQVLMERSIDQISNMLCCDQVQCDSNFNAAELDGLGFDPERVCVVNLPVSQRLLELGAKPRRRSDARLRLLFVGRFVPSKGVLDLVRAVNGALQAVPCEVELTLVGNLGFSESRYVTIVKDEIRSSPAMIEFSGTLEQDDLAEAFYNADIFVMPSYHEGYCLPALEAFATGCHVIAYDAGNLPSIVGNHGHLTPCGDVAALTTALADCFKEHVAAAGESREPAYLTGLGAVPESLRRARVRRYAASFSEGVYAEEFLTAVAHMYEGAPLGRGVAA